MSASVVPAGSEVSAPPCPSAPWPAQVDVLIVGAGPAGSACATALARSGRRVLLVDQHDFPREKVCGDGLIPDAHHALKRLGVLDEVMARAHPVTHVRCVGPGGGQVDVPGHLAVLPRRELDDVLVTHARSSGTDVRTPWRFQSLVEDADQRVVGAVVQAGGDTRTVLAHWVVLATGARIQPLANAGLCTRRTPSGIALRTYVRHPGFQHDTMDVVWHRRLRPGYGWIFPCGKDVFNIGVGAFFRRHDARDQAADANLREVFDTFTRIHPAAARLMDGGEPLGDLRGAPLRCTLEGALHGRPGLLTTGEALGSTYDFTGEGIGKALETGLLAADALQSVPPDALDGPATQTVLDRYQHGLNQLKPRFDLYARANGINRHPWLADLVIWRARHSPRLLRSMSGVLDETSNPGHLLSVRGLWKLLRG